MDLDTIDVFVEATLDEPWEVLVEALRRLARVWQGPYRPAPAVILERCQLVAREQREIARSQELRMLPPPNDDELAGSARWRAARWMLRETKGAFDLQLIAERMNAMTKEEVEAALAHQSEVQAERTANERRERRAAALRGERR